MVSCGLLFADNGTMESLIWKNLNFFCYENAMFLAEQLYAQDKTESSAYILATCFHRFNRPNQAKKLLQCSAQTQPLTRYLYAQCCLETGDLSAAEDALMTSRTGLAFVQAQQASQSGTGPNDDLARLCQEFGGDNLEDSMTAGFALKLLGDVYRRTDRNERAAECYRRALGVNPSLWTCYEALCSLGEAPDPAAVFPMLSTAALDTSSASSTSAAFGGGSSAADCGPEGAAGISNNGTRQFSIETASVSMNASDASASGSCYGSASLAASAATAAAAAAAAAAASSDYQQVATPAVTGPIAAPAAIADAPMRRRPRSGRQQQQQQQQQISGVAETCTAGGAFNLHYLLESAYSTPLPSSIAAVSAAAAAAPVVATPASLPAATAAPAAAVLPVSTPVVTQGHRALAMSPLGAKENNQGVRTRAQTRSLLSSRAGNTSRRSRSFRNKDSSAVDDEKPQQLQQQQPTSSLVDEPSLTSGIAGDQQQQQQQRSAWLLPKLRQLANAYRQLSNCQWSDAARQLESLPPKLHYSGPALQWLSRAYYELEDYHGACRLYSELRQRQPWNLRGMDVYSSTLWYLQKEAQLSSLARELLEVDRCAAVEPWCAAGNCFSLQREHEIALKYFRRATQVNPYHAYAYVLLALEYTSIDQLDKALAAFRTAVRLEPRAYNAWYGISNVYFKQEKFTLAECHFHKALRIYPNSAVLLTNFGVTKARMGRLGEALELFTRAKALSPKMPLCRYQRASVLFALERYQEALQELNSLRQLTPKESRVFFLLGRVYKALDQDHQAMVFFNWAMDLDPRGVNLQLNDTLEIVAGGGGAGGADAGASESDTTMDVSMQHQQHQQLQYGGEHHQFVAAPNSMMMDESLSDQSSVDYDYAG